ncbi:CHAP domain-containing protein [Aquimarina muelleri]|uniref:CHAP domain-containing protein n=1 Tax=Aquimarina muelleri TaxID=279356 RepID=UPI003F6837BC
MFKQSEKSRKIDNHTDEYSVYDTYDDKEKKGHLISFKVDEEGKGEALFTIPKEWENKHQKLAELPRYFYLKEKKSGVEFPRAYYVANPNKTEEENKKNSIRITALMLKVAKTLPLKDFMEANSAVILGSEPVFAKHTKLMLGEQSRECYCNKDFTADDLRAIVKRIRDNTFYEGKSITKYHKERLFNGRGGVPKADQTFEKFAEVLNASFNKHGITNCIHKIHFLANMYVETNYFTATEEFPNTSNANYNKYKPYVGRGFMHLTHDYHYKEYSDIVGNADVKSGTNYTKVASDLKLAADTAGWYWKKSKLNALSETDDILKTTKKINGGTNGYKTRRVAWIKLKEAFNNYPYNCVTDASKHEREYGEGVLEEMRKWADQHVQYKMESEWLGTKRTGLRSSQTEDALGRLDCSEFVCRYLYKLGVTEKMKVIVTSGMKTQEIFRNNLGNDNIEKVNGSTPQAGDIFVWSRSDTDGHTGIVHSVDGDKITILEAIGHGGSSNEAFSNDNGGYEGKNCTRTSVYERTGGALASHAGWKGYFRPKNYTKKL